MERMIKTVIKMWRRVFVDQCFKRYCWYFERKGSDFVKMKALSKRVAAFLLTNVSNGIVGILSVKEVIL